MKVHPKPIVLDLRALGALRRTPSPAADAADAYVRKVISARAGAPLRIDIDFVAGAPVLPHGRARLH